MPRPYVHKIEIQIRLIPEVKDRLDRIKKQPNMPWKKKASWAEIFAHYSIKQLLEMEKHE